MAAGKSTVAQQLAERLPRSVHLRGDLFRRMIVNGRAEMGLELSPEAYQQLRLRYQLASHAAKQYVAAGFTVVYQDIIGGKELVEVIRELAGPPLHLIVLCPKPEAVNAREQGRSKRGYSSSFTAADFDRQFRAETPRIGFWLDSSDLSVDETVDTILANLAQAQIEDETLPGSGESSGPGSPLGAGR
ncbi:MAG: AAA family ATPase [Caldilineaceae bacterium]|nr:AAA family ATPase [Caldilineaceae bacterium]